MTAARVKYHSGLSWSMSDIQTQREVLRHTAKRMAIAVSLTAVMTLATVTLQLGTDPDAVVRVGHVLTLSLCAASALRCCGFWPRNRGVRVPKSQNSL